MGALSNFVERHFGVNTRFNPVSIVNSIGVVPTQIWRPNPDRLELVFVNLSINPIYLFTDQSVALTRGFYLGANGGTIIFTAEEDGEVVSFPWWGIAVGASAIFSTELKGQ